MKGLQVNILSKCHDGYQNRTTCIFFIIWIHYLEQRNRYKNVIMQYKFYTNASTFIGKQLEKIHIISKF